MKKGVTRCTLVILSFFVRAFCNDSCSVSRQIRQESSITSRARSSLIFAKCSALNLCFQIQTKQCSMYLQKFGMRLQKYPGQLCLNLVSDRRRKTFSFLNFHPVADARTASATGFQMQSTIQLQSAASPQRCGQLNSARSVNQQPG